LATVTVTDDIARWYEWDVTTFIKAEKSAGRNVVSLVLKNLKSSVPYATFNSREASANRPQLVVRRFNTQVNFQPAGAAVPAGYLADAGLVYADRGNGYKYGWSSDNSANTRDRNAANSPDQRFDTLDHMQLNGTFTWEIAVPNGVYVVRVVAGDPSYFNSVYKINVEGVLTVNGTPTSTTRWLEGTQAVTVSDGKLTVSNGVGSNNNKICFVEIYSN
jgi:hypothetical protein